MHTSGAGSSKTMHPAINGCTLLYMYIFNVKKMNAFPGAWLQISMHPTVKSCTSGAGCTLNFGHCLSMIVLFDSHCVYRVELPLCFYFRSYNCV